MPELPSGTLTSVILTLVHVDMRSPISGGERRTADQSRLGDLDRASVVQRGTGMILFVPAFYPESHNV